jgi:uncharacterized protein YdaU (DUF1376 family)
MIYSEPDAHELAAAMRRAWRDFKLARRSFMAVAADEGWDAKRVADEMARLEDAKPLQAAE